MRHIQQQLGLLWLELREIFSIHDPGRCPSTEDGKHVWSSPLSRSKGFDGCIWCGKRRK
jgi:hypothetical protein